MKLPVGLAILVLLAACHPRPVARRATRARDTTTFAPLFRSRHDSADSALRTSPVIDAPSVLVFWLPAGDTLPRDDAATAVDDLTYYTEQVAPTLAANDIKLMATKAETVFVALPNHTRRPILLSGLDYPYGYLLVDPGGPERILTGIYADDELLDEIQAYFDLTEDSTSAKPHITT
ncbi:MAG TPA: hypothetical protein VMH88_02510 [Gemmatimonadales bacterium]|nr:hypothetical protein [Gemmatimonadales bacterium]